MMRPPHLRTRNEGGPRAALASGIEVTLVDREIEVSSPIEEPNPDEGWVDLDPLQRSP